MASSEPSALIESAHRACRPISRNGQLLLERYRAGVDLTRGGTCGEQEVAFFRELCRLVEEVDLPLLSVAALEEATKRTAPSATAARRRRVVLARLLRILEADGLPTRSERNAGKRIDAALRATEPGQRRPVRAWLDSRRKRVCLHELSYEAPRIVALEGIAARASAQADDAEINHEWLGTIVQQVVRCKCPPVTRVRSPKRCKSCGATIATVGARPSPAPRRQRELESIGRRYLQHRRARAGDSG
jgi:hypothetical protein